MLWKKEGSTFIKAIGDNVYSKSKGIIVESEQIQEPIMQKKSHESSILMGSSEKATAE